MVLTYHDSCNVARASRMGPMPGGQFILPREVIKASCNHFYDMPQDTIHDATYCCGGGGGLLTDDLMELRVKGALPRMEALKHVVEEPRRDPYGRNLRHLQEPVRQGPALLRLQHGQHRQRAPAGQQRDRARQQTVISRVLLRYYLIG